MSPVAPRPVRAEGHVTTRQESGACCAGMPGSATFLGQAGGQADSCCPGPKPLPAGSGDRQGNRQGNVRPAEPAGTQILGARVWHPMKKCWREGREHQRMGVDEGLGDMQEGRCHPVQSELGLWCLEAVEGLRNTQAQPSSAGRNAAEGGKKSSQRGPTRVAETPGCASSSPAPPLTGKRAPSYYSPLYTLRRAGIGY